MPPRPCEADGGASRNGRTQALREVKTEASLTGVGDSADATVNADCDVRFEAHAAVRQKGDFCGAFPAAASFSRMAKQGVEIPRVDLQHSDPGQPQDRIRN